MQEMFLNISSIDCMDKRGIRDKTGRMTLFASVHESVKAFNWVFPSSVIVSIIMQLDTISEYLCDS